MILVRITGKCLRKRKPARCRAERTATSGRVSLERFPRIVRRAASELAQDAGSAGGRDRVPTSSCASPRSALGMPSAPLAPMCA